MGRSIVGTLRRALSGGALLAATALPSAAQQGLQVSGTVKNPQGQPVPMSTVAIPSLGLGVQTSSSGGYTLTVPSARLTGQPVLLIVRGVGYKPDSARVTLRAGSQTLDFVLTANPLRLGEVVVTGAGTSTTRERLGTVVNSVKGEDVAKSAETNIINALAAKAPGIEITSQAGDPGAGAGIIIRGLKTIEGNGQPLIVVDGMPIDNGVSVTEFSDVGFTYANRASDINPNDIESIEVLNGAAASGVYGLRAANGVILITTKSGRAGVTRYSFNSVATFDEVNRGIPLQRTFGRGTLGNTPTCVADVSCQFRSWGARLPAGTQTFDHFNGLMRTGSTFDNSLQISGGDDRRTFFLSAGATNQQGIYLGPNNRYDRYTVRLKATQQLLDNLRIGGNVQYADVSQQAIQKGNNLNGLLLGSTRQPPEFNPLPYRTPEGFQRGWTMPLPTDPSSQNTFDNPFWVLNEQRNFSRVGRVVGNVALNYYPTSWLTVDYTLGSDYGTEQRLEGLPPFSSGDAFTGQLWQGGYTTALIEHLLTATGNFEFNKNASLKVVAGQNLNSTIFRSVQVKGTGFIDPSLFTLNNMVATNLQPQNFESRQNIAGYFASAEAYLFDQLTLTGGLRADQSSALGPDNRTGWFPRAQVAWLLSNFLNNKAGRGLLSYAKLRASYGEVGRPPAPYQILTNYFSGAAGFAYGTGSTSPTQGGFGGLYAGFTRGDPNLRFERTVSQEGGFDFGLFDQKIDGQVTLYNETTRDVIFATPLPPSTGFGQTVANRGQVSNRGVELSLNARVLERSDLRWELGLNFARNRNRVDRLQGAEFLYLTGGFGVSAAVAGQPLGSFYGTDFVRCRLSVPDAQNIQNIGGTDIDINAACRTARAADGAMYIAADGFPRLDQSNYVIGDPNPDWLGGIRNTVTLWKKLTVGALIDLRRGGEVWNGTRGALQSYGTSAYTEDRGASKTFGNQILPGPVFGPGAGTSVAVGEGWYRSGAAGPGGGLGNNFNGPTSQFVEDGSFTRLREISVAYTFEGEGLRRSLGFQSVNVRLAGRNVGLWTNYKGIDPMTNLQGPIGSGRGVDYFNNPQTRSWVVNVTLNR
jgi:TonB-linked SusC/RagA family outer membrane protein